MNYFYIDKMSTARMCSTDAESKIRIGMDKRTRLVVPQSGKVDVVEIFGEFTEIYNEGRIEVLNVYQNSSVKILGVKNPKQVNIYGNGEYVAFAGDSHSEIKHIEVTH